MTFKELVKQEIGYEIQTTFWEDFSIAEKFGEDEVKDTYKRAFNEWKADYVYLTELVLVLNWKIWQWYEKNLSLAKIYDALWQKAQNYGYSHLKGEELSYFYRTLD